MIVISPVQNKTERDGAPSAAASQFGEELPVFCERCGYSLHGLVMSRCQSCSILQFHCPECGHHQPINTLRPAFQRMLGRLRAFALAVIVFLKLNFFGWMLFAWFMVGVEGSYERDWSSRGTVVVGGQVIQQPGVKIISLRMQLELMLAFGLFGLAAGAVGRMLLLRWKRGVLVGLVLSALVVGSIALGTHLNRLFERPDMPFSPFNRDFLLLMGLAGTMVCLGAAMVWPVWAMMVNVFLPRQVAKALLDWQRFRPAPAATLARE